MKTLSLAVAAFLVSCALFVPSAQGAVDRTAAVPALVSEGSLAWFDAADDKTIFIGADGRVSQWLDKAPQHAHDAKAHTSAGWARPRVSMVDGLPCVDFGVAGSSQDLTYEPMNTIRTAFFVGRFEKNESVFMLGWEGSSKIYDFHRGADGTYFNSEHAKVSTVWNGATEVANPGLTEMPDDSVQFVTFEMSLDASSNSLTNDRNISGRNGGRQLCEVILFERTLSEEERQSVTAYLQAKWKTVKTPSVVTDKSLAWFDASDIPSITADAAGTVSKWQDKAPEKAHAAAPYSNKTGPTVSMVEGFPCLDFGAAGSDKDLGYARMTTIRTAFFVGKYQQTGAVFLLGDWNNKNGAYNFHRGDNGEYFHSQHSKIASVWNGMNPITQPFAEKLPDDSVQFIACQTRESSASDAIGQDRNISGRNGGRQLCEMILFDTEISDDHRNEVMAYLQTKWSHDPLLSLSISADAVWADVVGESAVTWQSPVELTVTGNPVLTMSSNSPFLSLKLLGSGNLTLAGLFAVAVPKVDVSSFEGTVTFEIDATDGITADEAFRDFVLAAPDKTTFVFKGAGDKGLTLDYGTTQRKTTLKTHLVFDGGAHTFGWGSDNTTFTTGNTAERPGLLVKGGTELTFKTARSIGGWGAAVDPTGIIRVNDGGVLNFVNANNTTCFHRQRLWLDPGAKMTFDYANDGSESRFRWCGGATSGSEQIYVPESATDQRDKPAVIEQLGAAGFGLAKDGTTGLGIFVGANSKLLFRGSFQTSVPKVTPLTKFGAGDLEITGDVNACLGTFTANGGTLKLGANTTVTKAFALNGEFDLCDGVAGVVTVADSLTLSPVTVRLDAVNGWLDALAVGNALTFALAEGGKVVFDVRTGGQPLSVGKCPILTGGGLAEADLAKFDLTVDGEPTTELSLVVENGDLVVRGASFVALEWRGGVSDRWSDGNWSVEDGEEPMAWRDSASAKFGSAAAGGTIRVDADATLTDLRFAATCALQADGGVLTLSSSSFTVDEGVTATVDAAVFGSAWPTKEGVGTLVLTGTMTASDPLVADGSLVLSNLTAASVSSLTVPNDVTLKIAGVNNLSGAQLALGSRARVALADGATAATLHVSEFASLGDQCVIAPGVTVIHDQRMPNSVLDGKTLNLQGVLDVCGLATGTDSFVIYNDNSYSIIGAGKDAQGELWLRGLGLYTRNKMKASLTNIRLVAANGQIFNRIWGSYDLTDVTFVAAGKDANFNPSDSGDVYVYGTVTFDTTDAADGETPRTITMGVSNYRFRSGSGDVAQIRKIGAGTLVWRNDALAVKSGIAIEEGTFDYGLMEINSSLSIAPNATLRLDLPALTSTRTCASGCEVGFDDGAKLVVVPAANLAAGEIVLIDRLAADVDVTKIALTVESETLKGELSRDGDRLLLTLMDENTYTWIGKGQDLSFGDPENWRGRKVPANGGTLCFNADGDVTIENDIYGLEVATVSFMATCGGQITLTGRPLALTGELTNLSPVKQTIRVKVESLSPENRTIMVGGGLELADGFTAAGAVDLVGNADGDGLTLGGESAIAGDFRPGSVAVKGTGSLVCDGTLVTSSATRFGLANALFGSLTTTDTSQNPHFTGGHTVFMRDVNLYSNNKSSRLYIDAGAVVDMPKLWGSYVYNVTVDGVLNVSGQLGNDGGDPMHSGTGVVNVGRCAWGSRLDVTLKGGLTVNTKGTASLGGQEKQLSLDDATFGCSDGDLTIGMTLDLPSGTTGTLRTTDTNGVARTITVDKALTGAGTLTVAGAGTVVLKATPDGTPCVSIQSGTLKPPAAMTVSGLSFGAGGCLLLPAYGAATAAVAATGTVDLSNARFAFEGPRQRTKTALVDVASAEVVNVDAACMVRPDGLVDSSWKFVIEDGVLYAVPRPGLMIFFR